MAAAAVLGVVAGTCTGFLVQAHRAPDQLPSLSQATLAQAKGNGPEPLSAAGDRAVKTDGDLRKLLLKKPSDARSTVTGPGDGWLDLADYAEEFTQPDVAFRYQIAQEFRRAAVAKWSQGTRNVEIALVQYRQEDTRGASDAATDAYYYGERESHSHSWGIPGTGDGMVFVHDSRTAGGYQAEAHAWRGDVAMAIWVYDSKPVTKKTIMDLAERQMGRL
ncbi:hypothetical protein [Streptomyces sp. NPDC005423]|uniref:hypothetical protein n=1 Tax=Streptomyces sp. NPDC005423 TaxID=3155343 RepID=UPI0033ACE3A1